MTGGLGDCSCPGGGGGCGCGPASVGSDQPVQLAGRGPRLHQAPNLMGTVGMHTIRDHAGAVPVDAVSTEGTPAWGFAEDDDGDFAEDDVDDDGGGTLPPWRPTPGELPTVPGDPPWWPKKWECRGRCGKSSGTRRRGPVEEDTYAAAKSTLKRYKRQLRDELEKFLRYGGMQQACWNPQQCGCYYQGTRLDVDGSISGPWVRKVMGGPHLHGVKTVYKVWASGYASVYGRCHEHGRQNLYQLEGGLGGV